MLDPLVVAEREYADYLADLLFVYAAGSEEKSVARALCWHALVRTAQQRDPESPSKKMADLG